MKDHNFYSQHSTGEIVLRWYDDQSLAQVLEWPNSKGMYDHTKVASMMQRAYQLGKEHKQKELLLALGIEGNA